MPISVHFSSVIPKISVFALAISCLTTSNSPWLMDLTFLVPMQYCSLQHQTLLPSPVTSTSGQCFCFGSASSFWNCYCAPTELGSSSFSVMFFDLYIHTFPSAPSPLLHWHVYISAKTLLPLCSLPEGFSLLLAPTTTHLN